MAKSYDLGYLLSPLVPEEKIGETLDQLIKQPLATAGSSVTGEISPRLIPLAYPIKRTIEHKSTTFRDAYLGALLFTAEPEEIAKIEEGWRRSTTLVRFLLIQQEKIEPKPRPVRTGVPRPAASDPAQLVVSAEATAAAIDKEIDELLTPVK